MLDDPFDPAFEDYPFDPRYDGGPEGSPPDPLTLSWLDVEPADLDPIPAETRKEH